MLVDKLKGLPSKPRFALHKFSSCDGCQLNLVNDALSLLTVAQLIDIVHFAEAGPVNEMADVEVAFIEGSVNTHHDVERIREIRSHTKYLIAIGACATSGGIQGFRNNISKDKFAGWMKAIYPQHTDVIEEHEVGDVQPISKYVTVDFELRGCPVSPQQMYSVIRQLLFGVEPEVIKDSVCTTCKHRGITCVMVARNEP